MKKSLPAINPTCCAGGLLALCAAMLLSACGGSGGASNPQVATPQASGAATGTTTLQLDHAALPDAAALQTAQPTFHVAPVLLNAPDDADAVESDTTAHRQPRTQAVPAEFAGLSTRRLTVQTLEAARLSGALSAQGLATDGSATPLASGRVVATYSPAQVRAAYGLPTLPVAGTTITAGQATQLGAGQTIYLIDAMHDPNIAAELTAFNQKFGLPVCTTKTIATNTSLPLATASTGGCEFSVVYMLHPV